MANISELVTVYEFLSDHPEVHDQGFFVCDTAGCIAGWTVALKEDFKAGMCLDNIGSHCKSNIGKSNIEECAWIENTARNILELTYIEAQRLFYAVGTNVEAMNLLKAFIAREKKELTPEDMSILADYELSFEAEDERTGLE